MPRRESVRGRHASPAVDRQPAEETLQQQQLYKVPPHHYLHVLDQDTGVTRLQQGPLTFTRQQNETVTLGPEPMVAVPPGHYCVVTNPVVKEEGQVQLDTSGQAKLRHGDTEVRLHRPPFPLYPGETLSKRVTKLLVVTSNFALHLRALRDFTDDDGAFRAANDEWRFGPGTFVPRPEVHMTTVVHAVTIGQNQALRLSAQRDLVDYEGRSRVAGEEWLVTRPGAYILNVGERLVQEMNALVLTETTALLVRAVRSFTDRTGKRRVAGQKWLVRFSDTETFIPSVNEEVKQPMNAITLTSRQFCVIQNPVDETGRPQFGRRKLVRGECSFFLQPGEKLEPSNGDGPYVISDNYILLENEAMVVKALEAFTDNVKQAEVPRKAGERWMVHGPREYVPPLEVRVEERRKAIILGRTEGIYVRDDLSGKVRTVIGRTYLLTENEHLWEKHLSAEVEALLQDRALVEKQRYSEKQTSPVQLRDKTRVVTYQVPHNAATQIYDFRKRKSRVIFGPGLAMLGPDEQFTKLSLSGGVPKRIHAVKTLALVLGPSYSSDIITVETCDHARLSLRLAFNWRFDIGDRSPAIAKRLFSVPDFIGDACKTVASRVRAAITKKPFDEFHKHSASIIQQAVFGGGPGSGPTDREFRFTHNRLVITSIDIQAVEPVDDRTRESLFKSVQMAIEITTNAQEAAAKQEAERQQQEALGRLHRLRIKDEAEAARAQTELVQLRAEREAAESCGHAVAVARSRAEAARIEAEAAVEQAALAAKAAQVAAQAELARLTAARRAEIDYRRSRDQLEIASAKKQAHIHSNRLNEMAEAVGEYTLRTTLTSGGEQQRTMLRQLGIRDMMDELMAAPGCFAAGVLETAWGLMGGAVTIVK